MNIIISVLLFIIAIPFSSLSDTLMIIDPFCSLCHTLMMIVFISVYRMILQKRHILIFLKKCFEWYWSIIFRRCIGFLWYQYVSEQAVYDTAVGKNGQKFLCYKIGNSDFGRRHVPTRKTIERLIATFTGLRHCVTVSRNLHKYQQADSHKMWKFQKKFAIWILQQDLKLFLYKT